MPPVARPPILMKANPICYVTAGRECLRAADDLKDFLDMLAPERDWHPALTLMEGIVLYPSKEAAAQEIDLWTPPKFELPMEPKNP